MRGTDNLTASLCRLSWNVGASTSWNPQGLSRPVMGLLYLYLTYSVTEEDPFLLRFDPLLSSTFPRYHNPSKMSRITQSYHVTSTKNWMSTDHLHYSGFPGVKMPESEADYSPSSSAEVKNEWSCASPPPLCFHGFDRNNFTLQCVMFHDQCL